MNLQEARVKIVVLTAPDHHALASLIREGSQFPEAIFQLRTTSLVGGTQLEGVSAYPQGRFEIVLEFLLDYKFLSGWLRSALFERDVRISGILVTDFGPVSTVVNAPAWSDLDGSFKGMFGTTSGMLKLRPKATGEPNTLSAVFISDTGAEVSFGSAFYDPDRGSLTLYDREFLSNRKWVAIAAERYYPGIVIEGVGFSLREGSYARFRFVKAHR